MPASGVAGGPRLGVLRCLVGLAQGIAFLFLYQVVGTPSGAGASPLLLAICTTLAFGLPPSLLLAFGHMRRVLPWAAVVALVLVGVTAHDALGTVDAAWVIGFQAAFGLLLLLFIAQALVTAADQAGRPVAPYDRYFEIAWRNGLVLALGLAFLGAFWLLLWLGAALFAGIGIGLFWDVLALPAFFTVATGVAFALGVHLADARAGLARGIRVILLALLSWLSPLLGLIVAGFLVALGATGLDPLWRTGHGTAALLGVIPVLVLLVNATYQDGAADAATPPVLRATARLMGLMLPVLVALAGWGLALRVGQHGLTPMRVLAGAGLLVGACYAAGYAIAAVKPGRWMAPLEATNLATACVIVGVLLALLTPLADPWRLSVADQLRRLDRGRIAPEALDMQFLRFDAGRAGLRALDDLAARGGAVGVLATAALQQSARRAEAATPPVIAAFPAGRVLPAEVLALSEVLTLPCAGGCEAIFLDLDADGSDEILIRFGGGAIVMQSQAGGVWRQVGTMDIFCPADAAALREGRFSLAIPVLRELDMGGRRLRVLQRYDCD